MKIELNGVSETLLIPARARAYETSRPDSLLKDPWAVDILKQLDLGKSDKDQIFSGTQIGTIMRTLLIDKKVNEFMDKNPDGIVVNLGCGLDARYNRLCRPTISWFDLDIEETMNVRKHFFKEADNYKMISSSMFDYSWMKEIPKGRPTMIFFEGVIMYFSEDMIKSFFEEIFRQFPQADVVFDVLSKKSVKETNSHPDVKKYNAVFKWGIDSVKEFLRWDNRLRLVSEESYMVSDHLDRWPASMRLLRWMPSIKRLGRVLHIRRE